MTSQQCCFFSTVSHNVTVRHAMFGRHKTRYPVLRLVSYGIMSYDLRVFGALSLSAGKKQQSGLCSNRVHNIYNNKILQLYTQVPVLVSMVVEVKICKVSMSDRGLTGRSLYYNIRCLIIYSIYGRRRMVLSQ